MATEFPKPIEKYITKKLQFNLYRAYVIDLPQVNCYETRLATINLQIKKVAN